MRSLIALDDSSKVWIYQAERELTYDELDVARPAIYHFVTQWSSHSKDLKAYGNIFHRRFICLFVDESTAGASGCSIDSSVHFIKALGQRLNLDFFNRMIYTYMLDEEIYMVAHQDLHTSYSEGTITDDTLMFDNLVKTKAEFIDGWLKPLSTSWHKRLV